MIPYDKITILRNRHRARDLRRFREVVETYFERTEYVAEDLPVDWEGARAARSQINRLLPRVIQIVHAAALDAPAAHRGDHGPRIADVAVLRAIFSLQQAEGSGQDVLDLIDMALGVYDASRFDALVRTVNPIHYALSLLGFVAKLPMRALTGLGLWSRRSRAPRIGAEALTRLEAVAARAGEAEERVDRRLADVRNQLTQQLAENGSQLADLAERLDFAERILAQQRLPDRLGAPEEPEVITPV